MNEGMAFPVISGHTQLVSMIGHPVAQSASPATHTLAYALAGIDAVFLVFDVDEAGLPATMEAFRAMGGWVSTTVTMPLKQAIIGYLDELSDAAALAGAVNVVRKEADGRLTGHNSDGQGFMNNLAINGVPIKGETMTLVGPGGAGSAIAVQAALDGIAKLNVFAREGGKSWQHATKLIERVRAATACDMRLFALEDQRQLHESIAESSILANCTNVGMGEGCTDTPVAAQHLHAGLTVADVIYTPAKTQLLKDAEAIGCRTFNGLGMLDQQAVAADRIRFGIDIPIDEVRRRLSEQS